MPLDELPHDILYCIVDFVPHSDFEQLLLSCKAIYHACEPLIGQHNHIRKRWRHFSLNDFPLPSDAIRDIVNDPGLSTWIETADLGALWPEWRDEELQTMIATLGSSDKTLQALLGCESWHDILNAAVIHSPCLKEADIGWQYLWDSLRKELEERHETEACAAILLCLLPNVACITFPDFWWPSSYLEKVMEASMNAHSQGRVGSLTKLRRIDLRTWASDTMTPFLQLPSLVSIDALVLPIKATHTMEFPQPFRAITSIRLEIRSIRHYCFGGFLRQTQSLQKLHLHDDDPEKADIIPRHDDEDDDEKEEDENEEGNLPWNYQALIKKIERWTARTLEVLILDFNTDIMPLRRRTSATVCFARFLRLKQLVVHPLHLQHVLWLDDDDNGTEDAITHPSASSEDKGTALKQLISPSLIELHLVCIGSVEDAFVLGTLFCDFPEQNVDYPSLTRLVLQHFRQCDWTDTFREVCQGTRDRFSRVATTDLVLTHHWRDSVSDVSSHVSLVMNRERFMTDTMFDYNVD